MKDMIITQPDYEVITARVIGRRDFDVITFTWDGPEYGVIKVARDLLQEMPDVISKLPWKMVKLGVTPRGDEYWQRVKE